MLASAANDRETAAKRLQRCKIYSLGLALCPKLGALRYFALSVSVNAPILLGKKPVNPTGQTSGSKQLKAPYTRLGQLQAQWSAFVLVRVTQHSTYSKQNHQAEGIQHEWNPYGTPPSGSVARASSSSAGDATTRCASPAASWTTTMTT